MRNAREDAVKNGIPAQQLRYLADSIEKLISGRIVFLQNKANLVLIGLWAFSFHAPGTH